MRVLFDDRTTGESSYEGNDTCARQRNRFQLQLSGCTRKRVRAHPLDYRGNDLHTRSVGKQEERDLYAL